MERKRKTEIKKTTVVKKTQISKKPIEKKEEKIKKTDKEKYIEAVGRRKTAIARVRLYLNQKGIIVNNKDYSKYFPTKFLQEVVLAPLRETDLLDKVKISAILRGSGISAQAVALRHGISRALSLLDENYHKRLKALGFLTRDSRVRERKKPGLKRARRAPQWSKR
jgi:small subunit ribosomal protein S9